ncbi:hypothetical protein KP509_28G032900 [Ceratopteris richardii]|uniref:50S ribosomal protein 6, chloroplastic n=1 Tax=Ceratopteris richardii TaxID=49495 RepID=A0A8T2RCP5_CERRI|nr:hypothetical protein KP509_28G032900 [Ceratopteris richardii]
MASSVLSTRPALSCSLCSPSPASLSSSSSNSFVSVGHFRQQPVPLENKSGPGAILHVECSSRPQKKCTAHHNKTRPTKHSVYEKNRKPAVYPRLPKPPPVFTLGWGDIEQDVSTAVPAASELSAAEA